MKKTLLIIVAVTALALLAVPLFAQGAWATAYQGAGGWWARVQPQTDQQSQFADQASKLHEQLRTQQQLLWQLQREGADEAKLQAKQNELAVLREQLHKAMSSNRALRQQIGGVQARRGLTANRQGGPPGVDCGFQRQHQYQYQYQYQHRGQPANAQWRGRQGAGQFGWGAHARGNFGGHGCQGCGCGNKRPHDGQRQGRRGGIGPNGDRPQHGWQGK